MMDCVGGMSRVVYVQNNISVNESVDVKYREFYDNLLEMK